MPFVKGHQLNKGKNNPLFGKRHSKATKEKMKNATLENPVKYWEGKNRSIITIAKIRKATLGRVGPRKGVTLTENTKTKISKSKLGKLVGKDNGNWKGGISKIDKLCRRLLEYKQWREKVFKRDNYTCQECGKNKCYVTAHHKKGFSKILKENNIKNIKDALKCQELWKISNGKTLCDDCHKLTDNYGGKANSK